MKIRRTRRTDNLTSSTMMAMNCEFSIGWRADGKGLGKLPKNYCGHRDLLREIFRNCCDFLKGTRSEGGVFLQWAGVWGLADRPVPAAVSPPDPIFTRDAKRDPIARVESRHMSGHVPHIPSRISTNRNTIIIT